MNTVRTLIIYASKNGCTEYCARYLKEKLGKNAVVTNVENKISKMDDFDTILIGSSVHMGKIQKKITSFCRLNKSQLLGKELGLFVCCYTKEDEEGFIESLFDNELLNHATTTSIFGGEMRYDKLNIVYRKLFESLNKVEGFREGFTEPEIKYDEIDKFATMFTK